MVEEKEKVKNNNEELIKIVVHANRVFDDLKKKFIKLVFAITIISFIVGMVVGNLLF